MPVLVKKKECVGCTACASACPKHCIEMIRDQEGFFYPQIIHLTECIECGRCESVCPIVNRSYRKSGLPTAYAAFSKDEFTRMESSSGGIFTELCKKIILQGGVAFGASYDENYVVKHCCVGEVNELWKLRGAKYSESDLEDTFSEVQARLLKKQKVLFSGSPCQVAGLRSFLRKDYENLICVDFVCHGIPSPVAWKSYLEYRVKQDAQGELPKSINLRSKHTGWSRYQYSNVFEYETGIKYSVMNSESLFMKLFVGDYISRSSCENCKFKGYQRVSDITLGDFWGIWDVDPEMDDDKGTSVVLVQSSKGDALWHAIYDEIEYKEVTLEQAGKQNPSMLMSSKANPKRDMALEWIREGKLDSCKALFKTSKISMLEWMKRKFGKLMVGN